MRVLGLESSCDDTGVAVYELGKGLLAHAVHTQTQIHAPFGGVVPELASRDHVQRIVDLVEVVLSEAKLEKSELDAIAYTAGPGLIGALLVASCFGKSLAYSLNIPAIAVHHLEAHLLAPQLDCHDLTYPFVALLVSGGHCQIYYVESPGQYQLLGETLDDAVGEAFDKTAKLMGISYPGGPKLAAMADAYQGESPYHFPRPMLDKPGLDFSFSGLKTHALNTWNKSARQTEDMYQIAKAFQDSVIETLVVKCQRAIAKTGCKRLVVAGGVGANKHLRKTLSTWISDLPGGEVFYPRLEYCTDNGAMVAYTGALQLQRGLLDASLGVHVNPRWELANKLL